MSARQFSAQTPLQALIVERALVFAQELEAMANAAPDGQVIDVAEGVVLEQGRQLLQEALQGCLQAQAEAVEKKGRWYVPAHVVNGGTAKGSCPESC